MRFLAFCFFLIFSLTIQAAEEHEKSGAESDGREVDYKTAKFVPIAIPKVTQYQNAKVEDVDKDGKKVVTELKNIKLNPQNFDRLQIQLGNTLHTIWISEKGIPCVQDINQKKIDGSECRPIVDENADEKEVIRQLGLWVSHQADLKNKAPYKDFLKWAAIGVPPFETDKVPANINDPALAQFNEYMDKFKKKLTDGQAEAVKKIADKIKEGLKDPKKAHQISSGLFELFAQGLSAPDAEQDSPHWENIIGNPNLSDEQQRQAAAQYSAVQIDARKGVIDAVEKEMRKTDPRVADAIAAVKANGARRAYNMLLSDSYSAKSPQCATCGGMPNQSYFDETLQESVDHNLAMAMKKPNSAVAMAGSGAVANFAPENPVFSIGYCAYCVQATGGENGQYAQRLRAVKEEIKARYPGATFTADYDAKSAGEIGLGQVTVKLVDGASKKIVLPAMRIYEGVGDRLTQLLPPKK